MSDSKEVLVPDIGDYKNVDVIEVHVSSGDSIKKDDSLIALETDKATMDIPAPYDGVIKELKVKVGDKVSKDSIILILEEESKSEKQVPANDNKSSNVATSLEDILIPDIGSDDPVNVIEVNVSIGDNIEKDQVLMTLENDKASMDIPSPFSGTIKEFTTKVNDKVKHGDKIAVIETNCRNVEKTKTEPLKEKQEETVKTSSTIEKKSDELHSSPIVRRIAREFEIDLTKISGTGRKGRITREDLQRFVKEKLNQSSGSGLGVAALPNIDFSTFGDIEQKPLSRIKKISGAALHRNWVTVPHVTQFDEADITELENFRQSNKQEAEKKGVKLTPLVFIMKAVVSCLQKFPNFNSSLDSSGSELILKKYFHIGVAVDTKDGLVVPVVRNVDKKSLFALAEELAEISIKARDGKLTGKDMQGGCFTISSLGGIGGTSFTPIVNLPEVAILGVSKSQIKPVYQDNEFKPRLMLPISLSYDHRVIDGAEAVKFTSTLVKYLSDIRCILL